jgi:hypothetical protein
MGKSAAQKSPALKLCIQAGAGKTVFDYLTNAGRKAPLNVKILNHNWTS